MKKKIIYFLIIIIISFSFNNNVFAKDNLKLNNNDKIEMTTNLSSDANLKSLKFNTGILSPNFDPKISNYTLTVNDNVDNVILSGSCNKCKSISGLGNFKLSNGTKNYKINVVAEDDSSSKTYNIFITKKNSDKKIVQEDNNSVNLKKLKVEGYKISPSFNKLNNKYTVIINSSDEKIDIKYDVFDKNATVKINGNKNLKYGENTVILTVENKEKKQEYFLTVIKNKKLNKDKITTQIKKNNLNKNYSLIIIPLVAILIIIISWYFIFKYKK